MVRVDRVLKRWRAWQTLSGQQHVCTKRLQAELAAATGDATQRLASALRRLRRRVLLTLIARDATGRAELAEVVATMTALAELAVQAAVGVQAQELAATHGTPIGANGVPQDLLVVGMGKLGGAELNVSSDIDLIFVYDEDGETDGANLRRRITNHEFFAQLGRRVIALLNDVTADGFVFRVDMRLRPNGSAGPLAVSSAMLEEYLMSQGREWERFAWLKARIVSAARVRIRGAIRSAVCRARRHRAAVRVSQIP